MAAVAVLNINTEVIGISVRQFGNVGGNLALQGIGAAFFQKLLQQFFHESILLICKWILRFAQYPCFFAIMIHLGAKKSMIRILP